MKTKELKSSFLSCTEELLQLGVITKATHDKIVLGVENDDREAYKKITELLEGIADKNMREAC